jgi:hypothetical protein
VTFIALDMDAGLMNLTFDEPISVRLSAIQFVSLQNDYVYSEANGTIYVSLDSGESTVMTTQPSSTLLTIALGETEMARLRVSHASKAHDSAGSRLHQPGGHCRLA